MAEFPSLPLFTDALLGDTTHLTTTEFGAYMLMLVVAWRTPGCCLPNSDNYLARITRTGRNWQRVKPVVMPYWTLGHDAMLRQKRLTKEHLSVRAYLDKQSEAGKSSARKRKEKIQAAVATEMRSGANLNQPPSPTPTPSPKKEHKSEAASSTISRPQDAAAFEGRMKAEDHHDLYQFAITYLEEKVFAPAHIAMLVWGDLNAWLRSGCDLLLDIAPTITQLIGRARLKDPTWTPKTLSYFTAAILQAKLMRIAPPPPRANGNDTPLALHEKFAFRKAHPELEGKSWNGPTFQAALIAAGLQHRWKPD